MKMYQFKILVISLSKNVNYIESGIEKKIKEFIKLSLLI